MRPLVGIFRTEADLDEAIRRLAELRARWPTIRIAGGRAYNPAGASSTSSGTCSIVSEAVARSAKAAAREPRRPQPARLPGARPELGAARTTSSALAGDGDEGRDDARCPPMPDDLRAARHEGAATDGRSPPERLPRHAGDRRATFVEFDVPVEDGMVVLDALHWIQAHEAPDLAVRWNCKAAKCGSCSAEVNGRPSLTCKTRLSDFEDGETITVEPMRAFPLIRDLVTDVSWNYEVNKTDPAVPAAGRPAPGGRGAGSRRTSSGSRSSASASSASSARTSATSCATTRRSSRSSARASSSGAPASRCTRSTRPTGREHLKDEGGIGYCNITKCCTEVCPEHIKITDNAIIPLKERVADKYYDPIQMVWRKLTGKREPLPMVDMPVLPGGRRPAARRAPAAPTAADRGRRR